MNAPTTIRVTAKHIEQGTPREGDSCPIALAIKEQWDGPVDTIEVLVEGVTVYTPGGWYSADEWPQEAASFIDGFDMDPRDPVEPFEFAVSWQFQPDPDEGEQDASPAQ